MIWPFFRAGNRFPERFFGGAAGERLLVFLTAALYIQTNKPVSRENNEDWQGRKIVGVGVRDGEWES